MRAFLVALVTIFALYQLPACDVSFEMHTCPTTHPEH